MFLFWLSLESENTSDLDRSCHVIHFMSSPSLWQSRLYKMQYPSQQANHCLTASVVPTSGCLYSRSFGRFTYKWNSCRSSRTSERRTSPLLFPWPGQEFSLSIEPDATYVVVILQLCCCFPTTWSIALYPYFICMPQWFWSTKIQEKTFKAILTVIKDKLFQCALNLFSNGVGIGTHPVFLLFVPFTVWIKLKYLIYSSGFGRKI